MFNLRNEVAELGKALEIESDDVSQIPATKEKDTINLLQFAKSVLYTLTLYVKDDYITSKELLSSVNNNLNERLSLSRRCRMVVRNSLR